MIQVLENLRKAIVNDLRIKNSVLGKSNPWKNNHYEILSEIINESLASKIDLNSERFFILGNTISPITLRRIFEEQIKDSTFSDLRFLKTLEKLCIFLNYQDLNAFISEKSINAKKIQDLKDEDFTRAVETIKNSHEVGFENLKAIPNPDMSAFENSIIYNSPYFNRLEVYFKNLILSGVTLAKEISSYESYNFTLLFKNEDVMVIESEEFWNLMFIIEELGYQPYHVRNKQVYYFRKSNEENWKIWDNYNPDIEEIIKKPQTK